MAEPWQHHQLVIAAVIDLEPARHTCTDGADDKGDAHVNCVSRHPKVLLCAAMSFAFALEKRKSESYVSATLSLTNAVFADAMMSDSPMRSRSIRRRVSHQFTMGDNNASKFLSLAKG
jgi:hypothetical protein